MFCQRVHKDQTMSQNAWLILAVLISLHWWGRDSIEKLMILLCFGNKKGSTNMGI